MVCGRSQHWSHRGRAPRTRPTDGQVRGEGLRPLLEIRHSWRRWHCQAANNPVDGQVWDHYFWSHEIL